MLRTMQRVVMEMDDVSVKNVTLNDEKSVIRELVVMPVIKKESEHTPQQFVEIKKEVDDNEGVIKELVSMNQDVVKKECVQMNLLKVESVKEEQNVINELVKPCKSEDVVNSESLISDSAVIKNEIMRPIRIKKEENENFVNELYNEYGDNTLSTKEGIDTIYGDSKSEIVKVINVKKEEKNVLKELVCEYHENKVVHNKTYTQVDIRKFIVNPRTELLRHSSDGKQCMENITVAVNRSILKPNEYSQVHPDHTKKRITEDTQRQTVWTDNNFHGERNNGLKDVIQMSVNTLIEKEVEKLLQMEDVQRDEVGVVENGLINTLIEKEVEKLLQMEYVQRDEVGVVENGLIKTINIHSILRKSVSSFGDSEIQAAAALIVMSRDQKMSIVSSNQTNKITEPVQCINLVDSDDDDDDINYKMDEPSANQNITFSAMDNEFVDCDKEENNEDVPYATLLPTTGTNSELACREQAMTGMTEGLTTVDQLPLHSAPPILFPQPTNHAKPPISFPNLIRLAITSSPNNKMTLSEILHFIIQTYPYYRSANNGWKNSIRHTLTLSKWFMKIPKPIRLSGQVVVSGKGCYWSMDYTNYKGLSRRR